MRQARRGYRAVTMAAAGAALIAMPVSAAIAGGKARKLSGTVILVQTTEGGIAPGHLKTVDVKCPDGFDVIGGSYLISGAVLAHAQAAAPIWKEDLYSAVIDNPPTSPYVKAQDASATVGAECAVSGKPLVVNGPFGSAGAGGPSRIKKRVPGTIANLIAHADVANGDEFNVKSLCGSRSGLTAIGGGYTITGSLWADAVGSAVLSKLSAFAANVVNPKFNPALGVTDASVRVGVAALCSRSGQAVVPNSATEVADSAGGTPRGMIEPMHSRGAESAKAKAGTIVIKTEKSDPIPSGDIQSAFATCPAGYSVLGGGYLIGGDSVLAHAADAAMLSKTNRYVATVVNPPANINTGVPKSTADVTAVAECAKSGEPVVANGPFGGG